MSMDEYGWVWMSMVEYGWGWMSMDEYGWVWLSMDEYGWVWMSLVEYGWGWTRMVEFEWGWTSMVEYGKIGKAPRSNETGNCSHINTNKRHRNLTKKILRGLIQLVFSLHIFTYRIYIFI